MHWPCLLYTSNLVVIEIKFCGRLSKQILLEVSIDPAEHRMRKNRTMLVVRSQPLAAADKEILLHHWALHIVGSVRSSAAGANVAA